MISKGFLDDAKAAPTQENMPYWWLMNLQISQGEYTLFSANIFVRFRACIESFMTREKFRISERKVQIIGLMGS